MPERQMQRGPISPPVAQKIWRILIEECGAPDRPDDEYSFCHYLGRDAGFGHEYRFMGKLGFGGKFYNDHFSWRVGCYPEHATSERNAMIDAANERLAALRRECLDG